jgi:hypothetical protein
MAPSPMAEATRLTGRDRTFPAANTPGMLVLSSSGGRSTGQSAGGWPVQVAAGGPEPGKAPAAAVIHISTAPLIHTYEGG